MNEEEKKAYKKLIDSYRESHIDDDKHGFNAALSRNISSLTEQFCNILIKYFDDYTEEQFHDRMNQYYVLRDSKTGKTFFLMGFDYVGDFKKYHKVRFIAYVQGTKIIRKWFKFDEERIYNMFIEMIKIKGWKLYEYEKQSIRATVKRFYNILYKGHDTVEEL